MSARGRDSLLVDLFVVRVSVGDASQHILVGLPRRKGLAVPTNFSTFLPLPVVTAAHRNAVGQRYYRPSLKAMTTHQAVRRWIMTGAVAAITVTGTIYGADLKGYQDAKQVCRCPLICKHASTYYYRDKVSNKCILTNIKPHSKSGNCSKLRPKNELPNSKQHAPN